jgi:hypothetical protein
METNGRKRYIYIIINYQYRTNSTQNEIVVLIGKSNYITRKKTNPITYCTQLLFFFHVLVVHVN